MFPTIDKRATGINLRKLMDERDVTAKDVQQYLGLGCVQSVYRWLDGISMPTVDNLYALSELFRIPIDAIVCGNRKPILFVDIMENADSRERRLRLYYKKLQELSAA